MAILIHLAIFCLSLISLVLAFGIIWQSEKGLDHAYKFLTAGLVAFSLSELFTLITLLGDGDFTNYRDWALMSFIILILISTILMSATIRQVMKRKKH